MGGRNSLYLFTRRAENDLESIWEHIALDSASAADRVINKLEAAIKRVAKAPATGHLREDLADRRYRFVLVYSYLVVYEWERRPIVIIRILHAARDLATILSLPRDPE